MSSDNKSYKKIVLANWPLSPEAKGRLESGVGDEYYVKTTNDVKVSELRDVEIMLYDQQLDREGNWLNKEMITTQMPRLKFVQSVLAGVDRIDFEQIPPAVLISGNAGAYAEAMAEHVVGMVLYFAKDLGGHNSRLKDGIFEYRYSMSLKGKTMGIIGAGGIGQAVARVAKCLGMKTMGVNTSGKPAPYFDETMNTENLETVLKESDIVVLSLPLTVHTHHLIDSKKLGLMRKHCILVNVARGEIIEQKALYEHLKKNLDFKCANDVWWYYPKAGERFSQEYAFFELPNFLGTPHVSGFVPGREQMALEQAIDNIVRFAKYEQRKKKDKHQGEIESNIEVEVKGLANREDYLGLKGL